MPKVHLGPTVSRRDVLRGGLAGIAVAALGAKPVVAQEQKKLRIGWQPGPYVARYLYARELGLFEKLGVQVQHVRFLAGPPMLAGLRSGSLDVVVFADTPAVIALSQGLPLKLVFPENDNGNCQGLVVRKDSGIKQLADLRGKRVATVKGSGAEYALESLLHTVNLTRHDVQVLNLDVTNLLPAFRKGEIDAGQYWEPWISHMLEAGGNLLVTNRSANIRPACGEMVVRSDWLEQNRSVMAKLLRAWDSVTDVIRARPEVIGAKCGEESGLGEKEMTKLIKKVNFLTLDDVLSPQHPYSIAPSAVTAGEGLVMQLSNLAQYWQHAGKITRIPDFRAAIDSSVAEEAVRDR